MLVDLCIENRYIQEAKNLALKAVELAWLAESPSLETQVYDKLGYIHYLIEEIELAQYFHDL